MAQQLPKPPTPRMLMRAVPAQQNGSSGSRGAPAHPGSLQKGHSGHLPPSAAPTHMPKGLQPGFPKHAGDVAAPTDPPRVAVPLPGTHTDLLTTVTCLCIGISLGGPLPAAGGTADRALSMVGFTTPHATPLPRGTRGTGFLPPSSGTLKERGCRSIPLGFPGEFADAAVSSALPHPAQTARSSLREKDFCFSSCTTPQKGRPFAAARGLPTSTTGDVFFSLIWQFTCRPIFFLELLCRATSWAICTVSGQATAWQVICVRQEGDRGEKSHRDPSSPAGSRRAYSKPVFAGSAFLNCIPARAVSLYSFHHKHFCP